MKRAIYLIALVAMGLIVATSFAAAQDKPAATSGGQATIQLQGVSDVSSSKFQEYRDVPKGFSMPFVNLFATTSKLDFNLNAFNVYQKDQRYNGWFNTSWLDFGFDYNQVIHRMGNDAHLIYQESAPGVWSMPAALRQYYSDRVDAQLPTSTRTYDFYNASWPRRSRPPARSTSDSLRKRGAYSFDFTKNLPFALNFTYTHERKERLPRPGRRRHRQRSGVAGRRCPRDAERPDAGLRDQVRVQVQGWATYTRRSTRTCTRTT